MICPVCKDNGQKSRLYEGGLTSTAMYFQPYYDEEGKRHSHDGNTLTASYSCSNGHRFITKSKGHCPQGDYGSEPEVIVL